MKYIISAGGTGGHIYPALAIIDIIKKNDKKADILFIGTHNRMEKDLIPKRGIKYEALEIYGISKANMLRNIKNVYLILKAQKKCREIIKKFKPDIVIGVGGYVTYPVIKTANKMKCKTIIHEQNSIPGKTNKVLAKKVNKVLVSFSDSKKYFDTNNVYFTGNPCSDKAINIKPASKEEFGLSKDKKLVLFASGSLGSQTVNTKCLEYLKSVGNKNYEVLFVSGSNFYEELVNNNIFPKNVKIVPFIDNLTSVMKITDLFISRAGASTISEIIALNLPSILIPSPYVANNHQYHNAMSLVNKKCCKIIEEKNLNKKLLNSEIDALLTDTNSLKNMRNNLKKEKVINSSQEIYKIIKKVIGD